MNLTVKFVLSIVLLGLLCLMLPGSIRADTVNINSINVNSSPFFVDVSTTNLLAQYGITLANVTPGTTVAVLCGECGGNSIVPSSPPNTLTQFGNDNGMSYTLQFSTPLSTLSFNLAGNSKSGGSGTVVAAWSATAFDASGNVVSSVGDPSLFSTFSPFAPQPFTLTGPGIASVTFFTQCFNFCGTVLNIADLSAPEIKLVPILNFSVLSGDGQAAPPLTTLPKALVVKVADQNGAAVPGVPISFAITQPSGANGANLDSSAVTTSADGTASVKFTLGDTLGQYQVTALCTSCTPTMLVFSETTGKKTIFLIHGIGQDSSAMAGLAASMQKDPPPLGIDQTRYQIDAGYDFSGCANTALCAPSCTIGDMPSGTPNTSNVTNGARKLAQYINDKAPVGDIILIGYSMGGLIARDMIVNNYYNVLSSTRQVAGLITLGTPNLGYPFLKIDKKVRCGPLAQEMSGDFRSPAAGGQINLLDSSGNLIAAVSPYLANLNAKWPLATYKPGTWSAIAGTFCGDPIRRGSKHPETGCSDVNPDNDGVVCAQSATYTNSARSPLSTDQRLLFDPASAHTDSFLGTRLVFGCPVNLEDSLFDPPIGNPVFREIISVIQLLP